MGVSQQVIQGVTYGEEVDLILVIDIRPTQQNSRHLCALEPKQSVELPLWEEPAMHRRIKTLSHEAPFRFGQRTNSVQAITHRSRLTAQRSAASREAKRCELELPLRAAWRLQRCVRQFFIDTLLCDHRSSQ
jgi:hypothetical protein